MLSVMEGEWRRVRRLSPFSSTKLTAESRDTNKSSTAWTQKNIE